LGKTVVAHATVGRVDNRDVSLDELATHPANVGGHRFDLLFTTTNSTMGNHASAPSSKSTTARCPSMLRTIPLTVPSSTVQTTRRPRRMPTPTRPQHGRHSGGTDSSSTETLLRRRHAIHLFAMMVLRLLIAAGTAPAVVNHHQHGGRGKIKRGSANARRNSEIAPLPPVAKGYQFGHLSRRPFVAHVGTCRGPAARLAVRPQGEENAKDAACAKAAALTV